MNEQESEDCLVAVLTMIDPVRTIAFLREIIQAVGIPTIIAEYDKARAGINSRRNPCLALPCISKTNEGSADSRSTKDC